MKILCPFVWLLILSRICYGHSPAQDALPQDLTPINRIIAYVKLGTEITGVRIDVINLRDDIRPTPIALRVLAPKRVFLLKSLSQLHGLVRITSASQALRFVRLRTARTFWLQGGWDTTFEIITQEQMSQKAFLDTGMGLCIPGSPDGYGPYDPYHFSGASGSLGVLSTAAYKSGHFAPPTVRQIAHGFSITRWVVLYSKKNAVSVQEWNEFVGRDGGYKQKTIRVMVPPQLPNTSWSLPNVKLL